MPISRIKTDGIQDDAVTSAKIGDNIDLDGQFVRVPHGTTAERPGSPAAGYLRFNTDQGTLEQWNTNTNSWAGVDTPPLITSLAYTGSATAADPAGGETITLTGTNFKTGANVTVGGTTAPTISVVNSTTITFTTPVKTAGDYDVVVTNANGLAATLTNGISYNGLPAFTTAAGNVGSILEDTAMSTITIVAAEPDGGTLAYSITSGALPTGVSLGSANGQLTGTPNVNVTSNTTYNFTVTATDDENQTNNRAFNLIVLRPIYATSIDNSLRFNDDDSAYLSRTPTAAGNRKTWTLSSWVKRGNLSEGRVFTAGLYDDIKFDSTNALTVQISNNNVSAQAIVTNAVFRDSSAWYHIVVACDTTQATASNRLKLYVNGSEITSFSTDQRSSITQSQDTYVSNNSVQRIGVDESTSYFDGYLSDVHFIDGQALTPTSFAEEHNGVWAPKAYSGSYGTNGFKLDFADSSAIGNDVSGNNNDWTPNNFGTFDVVSDSPTTNFATFNPIFNTSTSTIAWVNNSITLSEGSLRADLNTGNEVQSGALSTFLVPTSGKWYWEIFCIAESSGSISGVGVIEQATGTYIRTSSNTSGRTYGANDIINVAFDADNNRIYFGINGTFPADQTPTDASDGTSATGSDYIPYVWGNHSVSPNQFCANFGQDSTFANATTAGGNTDANSIGDFKYTVPSGYLALCAKNLSESAINTALDDRPEDYFNTVLYTGTGTTQSITGLGFQPDFVWIKSRTTAYDHHLFDTVRGGGNSLYSNATVAENTYATDITFGADGFSVADGGTTPQIYINKSSEPYVTWAWKAGGAPTASNVATSGAMTANSVSLNGTLQSAYTPASSATQYPTKMSINTKAGFSIVSWTGNGSAGTWLPHGLNSTPEMMVLRGRDARAWSIYHKDLTSAAYYVSFASPNGESVDNAMFNSVAPNNERFVVGSYNVVTNVNYIGYLWHSVPGFSKFGKYKGTGTTDGSFVETDFKPAFVLVKDIDATYNWYLYDNKRDTENVNSIYLGPNTTAETNYSGDGIDFLSNGFKLRTLTGGRGTNRSGVDYIYMAFAEDPFKYVEAK